MVDDTEETNEPKLNIRESLAENFSAEDEGISVADTAMEPTDYTDDDEPEEEQSDEPVSQAPQAVAPPSDMNKEEREAFLNPTSANAHVLQGYLSRRSLETRQEYEKRRLEVERLQKQTEPLYQTYQKYENDYKRLGVSPQQLLERSVEWDQAMRRNPRETALEYLQTYGITVDDLLDLDLPEQYNQPVDQQQSNYLTRDEAERIAEERIQRMMSEQQQKEVAVQTLNQVQQFMSSKPLFTATDAQTASQLEERMAPIVQALNAQGGRSSQEILETAYNYVVKGDPMFSDLERKLTAPREIRTKQAQTAKAKAASRSISGSVGSASPKVQVKDIRENLRRRLQGL
jgi:DNA-binding protein H-NS